MIKKTASKASTSEGLAATTAAPLLHPSLFTRVRHRCWQSFKFVTRSAIYIPLFILVCLASLIGTQLGSRLFINLANTFIPDLKLVYAGGTLNKNIRLSSAHWQMSGLSVDINDLDVTWQPLCLLQNQLCVKQLSSTHVQVNIDTASLPSSPDEAPSDIILSDQQRIITLPFSIQLTQSEIQDLQVNVNDMAFGIGRLTTQAQWTSTGIRVSNIEADGWRVDIPLGQSDSITSPASTPNGIATASASNNSNDQSSKKHYSTDNQIEKTTKIKSTAQTQQTLHTQVEDWTMANLPQVFMPIPVFVDTLTLGKGSLILGQRQDQFKKATLTGSYQSYLIHIEQFFAHHTDGEITLKGDMQLRDNYPLSVQAQGKIDQLKEVPNLNNQTFAFSVSQDFSDLQLDLTAKGQTNLTLKGHIGLTTPALSYQVELTAPSIVWPLDTALYQAHELNLTSQGTRTKQTASLSGQLITPFQPETTLKTNITHEKQTLNIKDLDAKSAMGNIELNGSLVYGNDIKWQANVITDKLDLSQIELAPLDITLDYPIPMSQISGQFSTEGQMNLSRKTWQLAIANANLSGSIDDYPLTLTGDVSLNHDFQLNANTLNLTAFKSQLILNGGVTNNWSLNGKLNIPELQLWDPNASGTVNADINITGQAHQPQANITFTALKLSYLDYTINKAHLSGQVNLFDDNTFSVALSTQGLSLNSLDITSANIKFQGNKQSQRTQIATLGDITLNSQIDSQSDLDKKQFDAQVNTLSLNSKLGDLNLNKPIVIHWDQAQILGDISPFCWQETQSQLCLTDAATIGKNGQATIHYQGNLGQFITPIMPKQVTWSGPAKIDSQVQWTEKTPITGLLTLALAPGELTLTQVNGDQNAPIIMKYETLDFSADLNQEQINTKLTFTSENLASIDSQLSIQIAPENRKLSGYATLKQIKLTAIADFLPQLDTLTGELSSELTIAGTLSSPTLSGHVSLQEASILTASNPTPIEDLNLNVNLTGQKANIKGQWKMGNGTASTQGVIDWSQAQPQAKLTLTGSQLSIIQPPLAILKLTPDLIIDIADNTLNVTGKLDIPSGEITLVELPEGGVAVSKDVVFEDSIATQEKAADPMAITTNLKMKIGEQLSVEGMGLTGRLTGDLNLKQTNKNQTQLFGDIKIIDGTYKFMGQTLTINTGELQFVGPIDEPNLNIEAIREIKADDITAGVRITGTPKKPIVTLFSSPAMEQAEILSYILKGTGLESGNDSLMLTAAFTLSQQAGVGTGTISNLTNTATGLIEKLGFSNVQLDTNDDGKVAISGYIGDKLMVKYGMGVFDSGYEMTVRYYLLSQLYLETVSGALEQSLDLYYNFNL
ncbi:autotransporter assembly complex protein TamB [Shewanella surugensis]|uniref:Translocation/assembly module TamB domain-containing protein n=1 Tax=Shewanella surugensis TaxID=212020 RepID=A0ABT0L6R1_9GAMM|nr:translocation/assembly module TamB domain-containing protein [Shewanella surugensis]MCL1123374.1 translocation/assembly module TamB domain-containing protein [Shewanella surugensis]